VPLQILYPILCKIRRKNNLKEVRDFGADDDKVEYAKDNNFYYIPIPILKCGYR
jgi:hypothetical protein